MMSQEFENYYLQTKGASSWETIEEAQKLDSLVVKLEDKKADFSGLKVRIIGGTFDEENSIWKYQQLFFHDQSHRGGVTLLGRTPQVGRRDRSRSS